MRSKPTLSFTPSSSLSSPGWPSSSLWSPSSPSWTWTCSLLLPSSSLALTSFSLWFLLHLDWRLWLAFKSSPTEVSLRQRTCFYNNYNNEDFDTLLTNNHGGSHLRKLGKRGNFSQTGRGGSAYSHFFISTLRPNSYGSNGQERNGKIRTNFLNCEWGWGSATWEIFLIFPVLFVWLRPLPCCAEGRWDNLELQQDPDNTYF